MRPALAMVLAIAVCASESKSGSALNNSEGDPAAVGDSLYFAGQPAEALRLFDSAFASGGDDARNRWRATRAAIAVGMLRADLRERLALYDRALDHARRGLALGPDDLESRYWLAAAAGRRAHKDDPVYTGRLALEVYEQTTAILAADSMHAGAHHALGMLHSEILRTPRIVRFLAGRVLRVDAARKASWLEAERHMRRATELDSAMVLYLVDLADFYTRRGRPAEARAVLVRLAATPSRHPMDVKLREGHAVPPLAVLSRNGN